MKRLSKNVKKMLAGLAQQDAGEYLSMRKKIQILDQGMSKREQARSEMTALTPTPRSRRIAFITDGRGIDMPLNYALEACIRENARLDLLVHGSIQPATISNFKNKTTMAEIAVNVIAINEGCDNSIVEYCINHPSLSFVVAMPDDPAVHALRLPIPLVLIACQPDTLQSHPSAA